MSTLTRTNSHIKKPQYKDYVSFLDNYKTLKKDDQSSVKTSDSGVNFSLSNSSNNSSNSVFSDLSDGPPKTGHINKNNPIQPKQAVKTEVFIEIKNPPVNQSYPTQVFEIQNIDTPQEVTISVSSATKIFEKNSQPESQKANSLQPKHSFSKKSSTGEISKTSTINEISKKFEDTSQSHKLPPKRTASIGEVSKIFENNHSSNTSATLRKAKNFNSVPKPFQTSTLPRVTTEVKVVPLSPKPAILSPKPVLTAPQFPKFSQEPIKSASDNVDSAFSSLSISPSPPQSISPPPVLPSTYSSGPTSPPPPPPPLPPTNFVPKSAVNGYTKSLSNQNGVSNQKSTQNGVTNQRSSQNGVTSQKITVQSDEAVQQNGGTINRNDPRVKKAVYGALRNMYGAYHDQANDYLATLPKNRVKKNNGLDEIINSIASQGGLEKLNGRAIPKQEAE